jgi:hypothetical protein
VPDLLAANPGVDPRLLRPGMLLYVPLGSETAPPIAPEEASHDRSDRPRARSREKAAEKASSAPALSR